MTLQYDVYDEVILKKKCDTYKSYPHYKGHLVTIIDVDIGDDDLPYLIGIGEGDGCDDESYEETMWISAREIKSIKHNIRRGGE